MSIKPINAEVFLTYQCPGCLCEWSKTPKEVKYVKRMICGNCNKLIVFEPIDHVSVIPNYITKSAPKPKPEKPAEKQASVLTKVQEDAIMGLTGLGFGKKEAIEFVSQHKFQAVEDYIQAVFRKV